MKVEVAGVLGFTVDEQAATADVLADCCYALDDVAEQPCSQSSAFVAAVHPEPCEQRDRLRVAVSALAQPWRSIGDVDLGHGPGVVGHDLVTVGGVTTNTRVVPVAIDWRA